MYKALLLFKELFHPLQVSFKNTIIFCVTKHRIKTKTQPDIMDKDQVNYATPATVQIWVSTVFLWTYLLWFWHFWVVSCNSLHASRLTVTEFPSTNAASPSICKKVFMKKDRGEEKKSTEKTSLEILLYMNFKVLFIPKKQMPTF